MESGRNSSDEWSAHTLIRLMDFKGLRRPFFLPMLRYYLREIVPYTRSQGLVYVNFTCIYVHFHMESADQALYCDYCDYCVKDRN